MESSKVTRKGQVTIPVQVRRRLGLREGDRVAFVEEGDRVVLIRTENDVTAAFGLLEASQTVSLEAMDEAIRRRGSR
jgi:antitoxin PrlF